MACCLTAPSYYLNQCWFEIISIHPSTILWKMCQLCWQKLSFTSTFLRSLYICQDAMNKHMWWWQSNIWKCVLGYCPASRTTLIATRFWVVMICPIIKCLTVLEFSFILFDLCLFITIFNFILNNVPIVTFWIFTYHKIWILLIIFCFIWSYWIIYFSTSLEVFWSVVS